MPFKRMYAKKANTAGAAARGIMRRTAGRNMRSRRKTPEKKAPQRTSEVSKLPFSATVKNRRTERAAAPARPGRAVPWRGWGGIAEVCSFIIYPKPFSSRMTGVRPNGYTAERRYRNHITYASDFPVKRRKIQNGMAPEKGAHRPGAGGEEKHPARKRKKAGGAAFAAPPAFACFE